jgi:AcrR family transcriptional regulator
LKPEHMRERLVEATARVIRERGLAAVTIRRIAAAAGVAEGSVYNHFSGKIDLICAAFVERMPVSLHGTVQRLVGSIGKDTVTGNLEAFARDAVAGYSELDAHAAMLASDPDTAVSLRRELTRRRLGPGRAHEAVAAYLRLEEEQGRVVLNAPAAVVSAALLGACHEFAFIPLFTEAPPFPADPAVFARQLVSALVQEPEPAADPA